MFTVENIDLLRQYPLMEWDSKDTFNPPVIWWKRLDNRFLVEVRSVIEYSAELFVFDHLNNDKCIYLESIILVHGASFSPDVSDILQWEYFAARVVDEYYKKERKEEDEPSRDSQSSSSSDQ